VNLINVALLAAEVRAGTVVAGHLLGITSLVHWQTNHDTANHLSELAATKASNAVTD
jgi:hypothetical protein